MKILNCPNCGDACKGLELIEENAKYRNVWFLNRIGKWDTKEECIQEPTGSYFKCVNCGHESGDIHRFEKEFVKSKK